MLPLMIILACLTASITVPVRAMDLWSDSHEIPPPPGAPVPLPVGWVPESAEPALLDSANMLDNLPHRDYITLLQHLAALEHESATCDSRPATTGLSIARPSLPAKVDPAPDELSPRTLREAESPAPKLQMPASLWAPDWHASNVMSRMLPMAD